MYCCVYERSWVGQSGEGCCASVWDPGIMPSNKDRDAREIGKLRVWKGVE